MHGSPLGAKEIAGARKFFGWDAEPFVVPSDVLDAWRETGKASTLLVKGYIGPGTAEQAVLRGRRALSGNPLPGRPARGPRGPAG